VNIRDGIHTTYDAYYDNYVTFVKKYPYPSNGRNKLVSIFVNTNPDHFRTLKFEWYVNPAWLCLIGLVFSVEICFEGKLWIVTLSFAFFRIREKKSWSRDRDWNMICKKIFWFMINRNPSNCKSRNSPVCQQADALSKSFWNFSIEYANVFSSLPALLWLYMDATERYSSKQWVIPT